MKISKKEYENLVRDSEMARILSSVAIKADKHIDRDLVLHILGFIPEPELETTDKESIQPKNPINPPP